MPHLYNGRGATYFFCRGWAAPYDPKKKKKKAHSYTHTHTHTKVI